MVALIQFRDDRSGDHDDMNRKHETTDLSHMAASDMAGTGRRLRVLA